MFCRYLLLGTTALSLILPIVSAVAEDPPPASGSAATPADSATPPAGKSSGPVTLGPVKITASPVSPLVAPIGISPQIDRFLPPQTIVSLDRQTVEETTNAVDTEDAIKYLPSVFVRKRNNGDTQPTIQTRTWGINSSARSLVYVDDVPISALISNNNTTGAPRWGMVSPEQISGLDMLYGPFAAQYPGNSMGGVLLITTRMPESFEATVKQTGALQTFDIYKTHDAYFTSNTNATVGDKLGRFAWFLSANHLDSWSQPLSFITSGSIPAGTTGAIPALNKSGGVANVVGAGGLLHSVMNNVTGKVTFDVTDWLRAAYTIGYWNNDTRSSVQSYLTDAGGHSTYGGVSGFASNNYRLDEEHLMNSLTLKTDTKGDWDGEAVFTRYDYLTDAQHTPAGVLPGKQFKTNGYVARLDGTGWSTQDLKGIWRPDGIDGNHQFSFGVHRDQYTLNNPTYTTDDWRSSSNRGTGTLYTDGKGKTETYALWAQDAWRLTPAFTLTLGGRLEFWRAYDGFNLAGNVAVDQPTVRSTNFSPKATLAWQIDPVWSAKVSFGQAYRYPTVSELYQIVSTGQTYAVPNPNLTPENVYSGELSIARQIEDTSVRVSFFQENTRNALIAQTDLINNVYTTTFQNVRRTRNRGVELVVEQRNAFVSGLDLSGSITYVDSRILSDPSFESSSGTTATGKHVPYVPAWRYTLQATYRPTDHLALSVAARYQGRMYSTLDNTDSDSKVFGAFTKFFVFDTHVHYQINDTIVADAGIDNLFNEKYFEYHPFPARTYVASLKLKF